MAKTKQSMYFAVKLVASRVGDSKMQSGSVAGTVPTKHCSDTPDSPVSQYLTIGGKAPATFPGIAGHFAANVLDFNDAEDAACKTVAEAEQLVKRKYKSWLADAYDWYVIPAFIERDSATAPRTAAKKPARK